MKLLFGFGILFSLLTALFLYLYYYNSTHANNLQKRGLIAEAEIIRKFEESVSSSSGSSISDNSQIRDGGVTRYYVEYEYETEDGQLIVETENVGEESQKIMEIGDYYDVKYDPEQPKISTLAYLDGYQRGADTLKILIAIFSILSIACWGFYFKK